MIFIEHKTSLKVRVSLTTQPRFASFHAVYVTPVEIGISRDCILVIYFILLLSLFYIYKTWFISGVGTKNRNAEANFTSTR